jgi:hypothetical protein
MVATTRVLRGAAPRLRRAGLEAPESPGTDGQSRRTPLWLTPSPPAPSSVLPSSVVPSSVVPSSVVPSYLGVAFLTVLASVTPPALPIQSADV